MPADKPTELSRIKLKTWTRQPVPMISKHSAHSTSLPVGFRTWLWRYTCLLLLISMLWHRQAIFESKGDKLFPLLNAGFEPKVSDTYWPADWIPADKPTELSRINLRTWTRQPVPMISKHSAHSTSLPVGFLLYVCSYRCIFLLTAWRLISGTNMDHVPNGAWYEITYPLPNFNGIVAMWKWITSFIPHFVMNVITHPHCY